MNWLPHAFEASEADPAKCRACPLDEGSPVHLRPVRSVRPVSFVEPIFFETPEQADERAWASFLLGGVIGFCVGFAVAALIVSVTGGPTA